MNWSRRDRPQRTHAQRHQDHAQRQRRRRFIALMPVRMILVRVLLARMVRQQHHKVRNQIGEHVVQLRSAALCRPRTRSPLKACRHVRELNDRAQGRID